MTARVPVDMTLWYMSLDAELAQDGGRGGNIAMDCDIIICVSSSKEEDDDFRDRTWPRCSSSPLGEVEHTDTGEIVGDST